MDQIFSFIEAHTADICLLFLGVLTSICNFIIMYFRTKTSRLEKIRRDGWKITKDYPW